MIEIGGRIVDGDANVNETSVLWWCVAIGLVAAVVGSVDVMNQIAYFVRIELQHLQQTD